MTDIPLFAFNTQGLVMSQALKAKVTLTEYLQGEMTAELKHEFVDGEAYAMAGVSKTHNRISLNLASDLKSKLKGTKCTPFIAEMKVYATGDVYYPDIVVACEEHEDDTDYIVNAPTLVVEVLSKSTRKFDRSIKQAKYLQIPSLEYYVLIEQDICEITVLSRAEEFIPHAYFIGDEIPFPALDLTVAVADIYDGIENEDMTFYLQSLNQ